MILYSLKLQAGYSFYFIHNQHFKGALSYPNSNMQFDFFLWNRDFRIMNNNIKEK